jgi:hypothetical protein
MGSAAEMASLEAVFRRRDRSSASKSLGRKVWRFLLPLLVA